MAQNRRDFKVDSLQVGNLQLALTEDKDGNLVFRDACIPQGVRLKDLLGALNLAIQNQVVINTNDIAELFSIVAGLSATQSELIEITGFLHQQIINNGDDIDILFTLIEQLSAADDDFFSLLVAISSSLQDDIDQIATDINAISGDWARLSQPNVFLTDNFFNTNVSIANELFVGDMIHTQDITISGCASIIQKEKFRDEISVYSRDEIDALLAQKIDKVPDAIIGNLAVFGPSGCLVDGGLSPTDIAAATGDLQIQINNLENDLINISIDLQNQIDEVNTTIINVSSGLQEQIDEKCERIEELEKNIVFTELPGLTAATTDCVPISATDGAMWMLTVIDEADITNKYGSIVWAMHDGSGDVDFSEFGVVETGGSPPDVDTDVIIASGLMCISVTADPTFKVKLARVRTSRTGEIL